ncbi:MAG TPA: hypothetical protein VFU82_02405 [Gammaproteobacteria bacterium]|nr:hypothetical protein [Gammaproteobacteria bacterium]
MPHHDTGASTSTQTALTMDDCGRLLQQIRDEKFDALDTFIQTMTAATIDSYYFILLEKALNYYANLCRRLPQNEIYTFITKHAILLWNANCDFFSVLGLAVDEESISEKTAYAMMSKVAAMYDAIAINAIHLVTAEWIKTPENKADMEDLLTITKLLSDILMENDNIFRDMKTLPNDINDCVAVIIQHIIDHLRVESDETKDLITRTLSHVLIILRNLRSKLGTEAIQKTHEQYLSAINHINKKSASCPAMLFTPPQSGIAKQEALLETRFIFSDFDETLYETNLQCIKPEVAEQLRILHHDLNTPTYVITARHHEMDREPHYLKKQMSGKMIFIPPKAIRSVYSALEKHQLHEIIPEDNIFYCNFHRKITLEAEAADNAGIHHYFTYDQECKKTKTEDLLQAAEKLGIHTRHIAIFDDREDVWENIKQHTQNFFLVNNEYLNKNMFSALNTLITQLVLYGDHIPLNQRISAGKKATEAMGVLTNRHKEKAAVEKFIAENEISQEASHHPH